MDVTGGVDIQTACRVHSDKEVGLKRYFPGKDNFLLVAPGE